MPLTRNLSFLEPLIVPIQKAKQSLLGTEERPTALRQFPSAIGETIQTGSWMPKPIRGAVQTAQKFITPETPEEAGRYGMINIGTQEQPRYFDITGGGAMKMVGGKVAQKTTQQVAPKVFKGFKDLTTKFLDYAKGKTALSKQEIADFARRPELKKGEADLLNRLGAEVKEAKVPAQEFADSLRRDLLELKPVKVKEPQYWRTTISQEGIEPGVKNYEEVVFESPITTNGSSHYPNSKNYFAHARGDEIVESGKKIWREQEIQSDLLQKEGMDKLVNQPIDDLVGKYNVFLQEKYNFKGYPYEWVGFRDSKITPKEAKTLSMMSDARFGQEARDVLLKSNPEAAKAILGRQQEVSQLQPFTNDRFGERIMRERIKEKAQKGYQSYRLPTGETIGKIEGFTEEGWTMNNQFPASVDDLKVGKEIFQTQGDLGAISEDGWIITDILGDGRFKAVPKDLVKPAELKKLQERPDYVSKMVERGTIDESYAETFDLTGKSNPQYRRYEDWGKFLKNKYGGKEVIDPQGNSWMEIDLRAELGKAPVEAFGLAPLLGLQQDEDNRRRIFQSTPSIAQ